MQQQVLARDGLEYAIAVAQRARGHRRVLQVRLRDQVVQLDDAVEIDRTVDAVHGVFGQAEILQQGAHDVARHVMGDLQAHRRPVAAIDQLVTQCQRQVLHFLLVHHQLGIAGDAELVGAQHFHAR
ncbi:hypothetical protein G6F46_014557 [Rhizopus delemar]|nr:hypothetical protein G6F46_014557 [Rhizopus delemar]